MRIGHGGPLLGRAIRVRAVSVCLGLGPLLIGPLGLPVELLGAWLRGEADHVGLLSAEAAAERLRLSAMRNELADGALRLAAKRQIDARDLKAEFAETGGNSIELKVGGDEFWPALLVDLAAARSSIHINIFGIDADRTGWQLAEVLAQQARRGVRVRMIADGWAAHRHVALGWLLSGWSGPSATGDLFDHCRQAGVEILFYDRLTRALEAGALRDLLDVYHFDHRKYVIIDGRVAYIGGYTLQQHLLDRMYDVMARVRGTVVWQLQSMFLASFVENGGRLEDASLSQFRSTYFPWPEGDGPFSAGILANVVNGERCVTDAYLAEIAAARRYLYLMCPYVSDNTVIHALSAAARRGVDVRLVIPAQAENPLNSLNCRYHSQDLIAAGVAVYEYVGERGLGMLHAKALARDDAFGTVGSCNLDALALWYNFEVNLVSRDRAFVRDVREQVFDRALAVSRRLQRLHSGWRYYYVMIGGRLTELLDQVD